MAITNEQIIFNAQIELLNAGKISADENGVPEEIHTFQRWKAEGFRVRKGAKALVELQIWKVAAAKKKSDNDDAKDDTDEPKFFLKKAFFFSASQVVKGR